MVMKGEDREKAISKIFHQQGLPILASPLVLRSMGAGQIDLIRLYKRDQQWLVQIVEVKTQLLLSKQQKRRLKKSAHFFGCLFGYPIEQVVLTGKRRTEEI